MDSELLDLNWYNKTERVKNIKTMYIENINIIEIYKLQERDERDIYICQVDKLLFWITFSILFNNNIESVLLCEFET